MRTDCGECFAGPATSELLAASGSSLRLCGEAGTTWQVATVSRGTREERIRPRTPSRASDLFLDYDGGRFVPASVRWRSSRRSESGELSVVAGSSGRERGLTFLISRFMSSIFLPERWQRRGAQVKETGGPAGSSEPVRVVRFRNLASPAAEAGATWQVANVFAKVRVRTRGGGGRTHTNTSFLSSQWSATPVDSSSVHLFFPYP